MYPHVEHQQISLRAIALIWNGSELLMQRVNETTGIIRGYRPIGGGVEYGETSRNAVLREVKEELGFEAEIASELGFIENIYQIDGKTGHEILAVFEVKLPDAAKDIFQMEKVPYAESGRENRFMVWKNPYIAELPVFPQKLVSLIKEAQNVLTA